MIFSSNLCTMHHRTTLTTTKCKKELKFLKNISIVHMLFFEKIRAEFIPCFTISAGKPSLIRTLLFSTITQLQTAKTATKINIKLIVYGVDENNS